MLVPRSRVRPRTIDVFEGAARRARSVVVGDWGRPDAHRRDRHVSAHSILTQAFPDRSAFPDEEHFAIWLRLTPGTAVSKGNGASRVASVLHGGGFRHRVQARETGPPGVALQGTVPQADGFQSQCSRGFPWLLLGFVNYSRRLISTQGRSTRVVSRRSVRTRVPLQAV